MAFNTLNKLKWTKKLGPCEVTFIDRGAPSDQTKIMGYDITELNRGYFMFKSETGNEVHIPMHRVLEISCQGKTMWKRRPGKSG